MLKEHARLFEWAFSVADAVVVAVCWVAAYAIRFSWSIFPVTKGTPVFSDYVKLLILVVPVWVGTFRVMGVYRSRRLSGGAGELWELLKGAVVAFLVFNAAVYLLFQYEYSRLMFALFWGLHLVGLVLARGSVRSILRKLRRRGINLRRSLIVGAGDLGQEVAKRLLANPGLGIVPVGFLTRHAAKVGRKLLGIPILGGFAEVAETARAQAVDQVILALPMSAQGGMEGILRDLGDEPMDIRVVPDLLQFVTLRGGVEELDGLPLVTLRSSPLVGANLVVKRAMDLTLSILVLAATLPLTLLIALLVKGTSSGPVLYRQERMGLDGRHFWMLKFRTMRERAEETTGPVWARKDDPRRTWIGRILRSTSLDELPQFWNVVRGEMSVVGPRPERPVFIKEFRKKIPRYMLRHSVKAGITGWAQVNGWRGDTPIDRRIEFDLYYIEHWSVAFDLRICLRTLFQGFVHRNAY